MIQKIKESKSWFFEKINKIDKSLTRCIKKKRERTQINKIRNEIEEITDTKEIQRIVKKYYEQLFANKLDNVDKMNKFLETYSLPKLNQEAPDNLNRQITPSETEEVINKLPKNKSPGPDHFTGEFYQTFQEQLTPVFLKLFQKIQEEGKLPSSFCDISIILISKPLQKKHYKVFL